MTCNSHKCVGLIAAKYVVKFDNKYVSNCPDCSHILFQDFGGNGKVKDRKTGKPRKGANRGLVNNPKEYL